MQENWKLINESFASLLSTPCRRNKNCGQQKSNQQRTKMTKQNDSKQSRQRRWWPLVSVSAQCSAPDLKPHFHNAGESAFDQKTLPIASFHRHRESESFRWPQPPVLSQKYCSTNGRCTAVQVGGVLPYKWEVYCWVAQSSRVTSKEGTAMQMGGALPNKLEVYCSTLPETSRGWGFWNSSEWNFSRQSRRTECRADPPNLPKCRVGQIFRSNSFSHHPFLVDSSRFQSQEIWMQVRQIWNKNAAKCHVLLFQPTNQIFGVLLERGLFRKVNFLEILEIQENAQSVEK